MTAPTARQASAARGVIYVHSAPKAMCPHVEWAVGRALERAVNFDWAGQPALDGAYRTEFYWEGERGDGAAIASALHGWEQLRFEVTEDAGSGADGSRWMHTPSLGIVWVQIDSAGNMVVPEDRIRSAMARAGTDALELHRELRLALGQEWDDELDVYRYASDFAPVIWLHKTG